ncbi:MAG: DUF4340 domain-containing protein [Planctomycetes bacterium]|nr:DUF4340 domain-containing protein [Planctomycetota bacterium]
MNQKTFGILAVVTGVVLAAGVFVSQRGESGAATANPTLGKRLFPELGARLNDVAKLTVVSKDATINLEKNGASWGVADKGGYPVDFGKVKQLAVAVSEMELLAQMTANPASHAKLGVEEPTAAEASSRRVTLKDASGAVLADLIVGKPKPHEGFGGRGSLFVRKEGESQAWEVSGQLSVAGSVNDWLSREIGKLEGTRVKRVFVQHADGNTLAVSKGSATDKDFSVENLPEGAELQWPGVAGGIGSALQYLSLDDVQKSEGFDLAGATSATFECFDGLVVTARSIERDSKTWVALSAKIDESLRAAAPGPQAPPPAEGEPAPETPKEPELKALEDVKKEADELNAKWSAWVYAVPGYSAANLRKKLTDLLKAPEPVAPPDGSAPSDGLTPPDEDATHGADDGHGHGTSTPAGDAPAPVPTDPPADKPSDG